MNLRIGIVGLPNAGKSTLFNALLKKQVAEAANYPFTTIEPNVGVVPVPDQRLATLATLVHSEEGILPPIVPAVVEFVDIAGLVKGASEGQGLGNKFLSHIREVDIICHVLRFFPDSSVVHVAGEVDPKRDRETIETELILADLQTLAKQQEPKGAANKEALQRWSLIKGLIEGLNAGKIAREVVTDGDERALIADLQLLTTKPVLLVANMSEQQLSSAPGDMIPISAKTESELAALSVDEQKAYLKELGLEASGLDRLIQKAYETLGLISFLTQGVKEVRAWTIGKGTKAPQAAGVIHTDFEKKFIKAEVIGFDELVVVGGWKKAKELGKLRFEGKEYEMHDGDVVEFKVGN
ncbi:redox-regulated ATPase YchF [Candidatus Gottesmanbacteria bacterium]|nr:redox-regulated ATPase YchF [Candidatus Gottesmanbacteria bacterium]